ncbi:MAG: DUF3568 family protein [Planctomycetota bacterium]
MVSVKKFWKRISSIIVLCLSLSLCPGCGVELAVIGAAASAASSGSAAYKQGKLVASWMGPFDVVVAAGEIAFGDLGYAITESSGNALEGDWKIVATDEDGDKVTIKVDRKTQQLTQFQIDVTWFGKEPTARLILKRMAVAINLETHQDGTGDVPGIPTIITAPATDPPATDDQPVSPSP